MAAKPKPKPFRFGSVHGLTSRVTQCLGEIVDPLDCEDALVEALNVMRDHCGLDFVLPPDEAEHYRETFSEFCKVEDLDLAGNEFYDHVVAIRKWCDKIQKPREGK